MLRSTLPKSSGRRSSLEMPIFQEAGKEDSFITKQQLKRYIGKVHFPETKKRVKKVDHLLRISELPPELRALFKPQSDRNALEKDALKNFDIDRDLTASRGGDVSRLGKEVVKLHNRIKDKTNSESLNPTNAVLETVGRLDFEQSETDLQQEINKFCSQIDLIADIDDPRSQERAFFERLEDHESQIRELSEELGQPSLPRLNFRLSDLTDENDSVSIQQYRRYHALAKHQLETESNAKVARRAYCQYLIDQAEKNGWD